MKVKEKPLDNVGCYYGHMGYGMNYNAKFIGLHYIDLKGSLEPIKTIFCGTVGKGCKIVFFKKEEFMSELAPESATIEYLTIDGKDYVRMCY